MGESAASDIVEGIGEDIVHYVNATDLDCVTLETKSFVRQAQCWLLNDVQTLKHGARFAQK
jgi:hypothetical protein